MVEIKIKGSSSKDEKIKLLKHILYIALVIAVLTFLLLIFKPKEPQVIEKECPGCECNDTCEESSEKIIYRDITKEVFKYVCSDGTVVDKQNECEIEYEEPELPPLNPITTNENGTFTKVVRLEPACIGGIRGGYVYYEVVSPAENVTYLLKAEDGSYEAILNENGYFKSYKEFLICDPDCPNKQSDFKIQHDKRYFLKIEFDRIQLYSKIEYSNEYIIDLTPNSEFMTKSC